MRVRVRSAWVDYRERFATGRWSELLREDSGQDLIEYALVGALIALGTVASTRGLAATIGTALGRVGTSLSGAI
jgi:pilus assembly protein Flp/PilA